MAVKLFGFTFGSEQVEQDKNVKSFTPPANDDGAMNVAALDAFGSPMSYVMDLDGVSSSENSVIERYREIAMISEVDRAIEEIVSEAIIGDQEGSPVSLNIDQLELTKTVKDRIDESFEHVLNLLHFKTKGYDMFRRWYIDGRINYHIMIDETRPKRGVVELRYIDPKKIKKVREKIENKGEATRYDASALLGNQYREYYIYSEKGTETKGGNTQGSQASGLKIAKEAIAHCNSGMMDPAQKMVISYLHKALRPANNLRMLEDSLVIYRLSRAPERRIFYVDVGNLPKGRAEQYLSQIMNKYKNKMVYDATTGEVKDDRRHLAMTEDYWIPRREGSRGTEIDTLPGGDNLGVTDDVEYFMSKMLKSLNVPMSRMSDEGNPFEKGTEITRDELRFSRFVSRLRTKFSELFDDILGKHLVLTGVMSMEMWERIKDDIYYNFKEDNYFTESLQSEILESRATLAERLQPFVGSMFSKQYIMKEVMKMSDDEITQMKKEIEEEKRAGEYDDQMEESFEEPSTELIPESDVEYIPSESDDVLRESMAEYFKAMTNKTGE